MAKDKTGLHKKIPAIFDGTAIPGNKNAKGPSTTTLPDPKQVTEKPPVKSNQKTPTAKAQPAPQVKPTVKPQPTAKPQPSKQLLPAESRRKQFGHDTLIESIRQIPWQQFVEQIKNKFFDKDADEHAKRQKIIMILCVVLSIVLIFVFIKIFSGSSSQKAKAMRTGSATTTDGTAAAYKSKIDWQIPDLYPTTLRDPMSLGSTGTIQGNQTGQPIVKGIVYAAENPSAIINGRIVYEGDKVSDAIIIKINKDSVDFEANGKKWTQKVQR